MRQADAVRPLMCSRSAPRHDGNLANRLGVWRSCNSSDFAREEGNEPLTPRERHDTPHAPAPEMRGRGTGASSLVFMRYAERCLGFLAGLLLAGVAIGIAYRYRFDPPKSGRCHSAFAARFTLSASLAVAGPFTSPLLRSHDLI